MFILNASELIAYSRSITQGDATGVSTQISRSRELKIFNFEGKKKCTHRLVLWGRLSGVEWQMRESFWRRDLVSRERRAQTSSEVTTYTCSSVLTLRALWYYFTPRVRQGKNLLCVWCEHIIRWGRMRLKVPELLVRCSTDRWGERAMLEVDSTFLPPEDVRSGFTDSAFSLLEDLDLLLFSFSAESGESLEGLFLEESGKTRFS